MRLTALFLLAAGLTAGATGFSQKVSLRETNAPLGKVFQEIRRQTGYEFLYTDEMLQPASPITIDLQNADLADALSACFRDQPLSFIIMERTVVVKPKPISPASELPQAPPIDVHGRILNENGEAMPGVNIQIKDKRTGVISDADGAFTLHGVDSATTLIISFVGYETQEIKLAGRTAISLKLKIAPKSLQDVVINKGYYSTSQRFNTGNVTRVDGKDIEKQPVTDFLQALEGRVAGLEIQQTSGVPGAYSIVRIRGENSLIGANKPITANDPLYIVDGVPFSSQSLTSEYIGGGILTPDNNPLPQPGTGMSPFNSINPSDIENIEILKDGDATAIYGSRGSNGVILITTKKGKPGKVKCNISAASGYSKPAKLFHLMNTHDYLDFVHEGVVNDKVTSYLTPQYAIYFPELLIWDTTRYTDWQKLLIDHPANFTNAHASLSGGSANTQFLVGVGLIDQGTSFPGKYQNQTASVHFNIANKSADDRFKMNFSGSYSDNASILPGSSDMLSSIVLPPDAPPVYDAHGNLNFGFYNGQYIFPNPLAYTKVQAKAATDFVTGSLELGYQIIPGLEITCRLGYSHDQMNQIQLSPNSRLAPGIRGISDLRFSSFSTTNNSSWIIEPQANYNLKMGRGQFDILFGTTFQANSGDSKAIGASGFSSDALITNLSAASTVTFEGANQFAYHYNAFHGRIGYNLKDKYIINLTGSRDGSSRFGPGNQFGNFGAIGAGWIFTEEKWLVKTRTLLSFGKLRASYGITGNDQIGNYQYLSSYIPIAGTSYQGVTGLQPTLLANPGFHWESNKKLETGLELGFLKDKVHISGSWYRNRTDNQLVSYPEPGITGFSVVEANLPALIQNTGWEFTLSSTNIHSKNFTWHTSANWSINRGKLISFPGIENTSYKYNYSVGRPLGVRPLYHYTGLDPLTGLYTFAAKDGSGFPQPVVDETFSHKPVGFLWGGGIENSIECMGFQLSFLIQLVKQTGQRYANGFPVTLHNAIANQPVETLKRWEKPGDISGLQRASIGFSGTQGTLSEIFKESDGDLVDASFARLKSLSLTYHVPDAWIRKIYVSNLQLYIRCENLFTITGYKGLDPETQGLHLPPMRTITGGLSISL